MSKYKNVTIQGSHYPDDPVVNNRAVRLTPEIKNEYLPVLQKSLESEPEGLRLLCTIMTWKEGFYRGTRSHRTNNPGNIGNTDTGANQTFASLEEGIKHQVNYIKRVAEGKHRAYPLGKLIVIKPYYSPEIARNQRTYGINPYLPGYRFTYTGQLDQFVKIYATGSRGSNGYLSTIISYFKANGIEINGQSTIAQIISMNI